MSLPPLPLHVLNHRGRDSHQLFNRGPGSPGDPGHPPVNYHAYAACLQGAFHQHGKTIPPGEPVLLLLRGNLGASGKTLEVLKKNNNPVFVSFKESGLWQVREVLDRPGQWEVLRDIFFRADGAISSTPDLVGLYEAAGARRVEFIPTPYPVEFPEWNFSIPSEKRAGIFLGTREFGVASRQHLHALRLACMVAEKTGRRVTSLDDGSCPRWLRRQLEAERAPLDWVRGPLPYPEYLRLLARHELVFQLDSGAVPGQVAGDCSLARTLCMGGNGAVESLIFSECNGIGRNGTALARLLEELLQHPELRRKMETTAQAAAEQLISYSAVAEQLANFLREA